MDKIKRIIKDCIVVLSSGAFLGAVLIAAGLLFYYIFLSLLSPMIKEYHKIIENLIKLFPIIFISSLLISLFFTVIMYMSFRSRQWLNLSEADLWRKIILWTAFIGRSLYYFQVIRDKKKIEIKSRNVYKIFFSLLIVAYCLLGATLSISFLFPLQTKLKIISVFTLLNVIVLQVFFYILMLINFTSRDWKDVFEMENYLTLLIHPMAWFIGSINYYLKVVKNEPRVQ